MPGGVGGGGTVVGGGHQQTMGLNSGLAPAPLSSGQNLAPVGGSPSPLSPGVAGMQGLIETDIKPRSLR